MTTPSLSCHVDDTGAYVLVISAIPEEHLGRPLIVTLGGDTLVDETRPGSVGWCPWCEEAGSPVYPEGGHDPECPLAPSRCTVIRHARP